jgi:hypothetical protein
MSELPRKARGRRNQFFAADGVDEVISMVLELGAEVSALRERQYILEQVLAANGIEAGPAVEAWVPSAEDKARMAAERDRLLAAMLRNFEAPEGEDVGTAVASTRDDSRDRAA